MAGCRVHLWRAGRGRLRPVVEADVPPPPVTVDEQGFVTPAADDRWLAPVPGLDGYWFEVCAAPGDPRAALERLAPLIGRLLDAEHDTLNLAKQLASRYEEIELLYTISEIIGRTIGLHEATETILREVSTVVGARRASIFAVDEAGGMLHPLAVVGQDRDPVQPVAVENPRSITAQVFRDNRLVMHDPRANATPSPGVGKGRGYRGSAFMSAPITYPTAEGEQRPIGVLNLTDRMGTDAFSGGERRLVIAVASQIGAAIQHARLVQRDADRKRLERELELAHDLQLKLLPSPEVLGPGVDVAAQTTPVETVGGDFYHFLRLPGGRFGVMLGDVSSHGYAAALIMALVRSAAGIHAEEALSPDGALRRLLDSVSGELAETEMFLTLFYGVADPASGTLRYANAGHAHAFRIGGGEVERLAATSPPLGLAEPEAIGAGQAVWRAGTDVVLLFTDGVCDARNAAGERFGEERVCRIASERPGASSREIVDAVMQAVAQFEPVRRDDRTVLVLKT